jgi:hypothetical protein
VTSTTHADTTGGDPNVVTSYSYAGPAWHYDTGTVSRSAPATYDQWRGFGQVTTETGTAPDPVTQPPGRCRLADRVQGAVSHPISSTRSASGSPRCPSSFTFTVAPGTVRAIHSPCVTGTRTSSEP